MSELIEYNMVMSSSTGGTPVYYKAGVDAKLNAKDDEIAKLKEQIVEMFWLIDWNAVRDVELEKRIKEQCGNPK